MEGLLELQRASLAHMMWADREHLRALADVSPDHLVVATGTSHGSLLGTAAHLLGSEQTWMARFVGQHVERVPDVRDTPDYASLREGFEELWPQVEFFLAALTSDQLQREVTWTNTRGESATRPLWQPLSHMTVHAAYHRGQLTTMLRQLGYEPPSTDLIRYLLKG